MNNLRLYLENKLFVILLSLMIFIPLYPKIPLVAIKGTYIAVRLEDVLVEVIFLVWLFVKLPKISQIIRQRIFQSILLFWAIGFLSLISALIITYSILPHLGLLHLLRRVEYMMLFIVAATTISSLSQVKTILKAGVVVTVLVILYGFGQQWLNFPVISTTNREFSKGLVLFLSQGARINSTFAGHYDLAIFLTMVLVILASLYFTIKTSYSRALAIGFGLLSFILLGLTAARVSFVAALGGLAISFWLSQKKALIGLLILLSLAAVVIIPDLRHRLVATYTVNFLGGGGPKYIPPEGMVLDPNKRLTEQQRKKLLEEIAKQSQNKGLKISTVSADIAPGEPINSLELAVHRSFGIRFDVEWPRALRAFYKNPFLGTGYSSITIATDNDLLRSLGEVGLLGTLGLSLVFFIIIRQMLRFLKKAWGFEKQFIIGVLSMMMAIFATATFIDVLEASKVAMIFWFMLGVAWATTRGYRDS